jgi:type I restriction enzyme S subunit
MNIIRGASDILDNWTMKLDLNGEEVKPLGKAVLETKNGWSPKCEGGETPVLALSCLKRGYIDLAEIKYTSETRKDIERFYVKQGDFFYSRGNTIELVALAGIAEEVNRNVVFSDLLTRVEFNESLIKKKYAIALFNSDFGRKYFGKVPYGASPSMVKVSQDYMAAFPVPFMGELDKQDQIIADCEQQQKRLKGIEALIVEAKKQILTSLNTIWEQ